MTIKVNAMGDACPIPVVKTQKAMQELGGAGTVETLVDNETAVQNLGKLAASKGCTSKTEKLGSKSRTARSSRCACSASCTFATLPTCSANPSPGQRSHFTAPRTS